MTRTALSLGVVVLVGSGCAGEPPAVPTVGPADPAAQMRPELIVADPMVVAPGGVVALTFPEETTRGVLFVLERRVGDSWAHQYNLSSDGPGEGWKMSWHLPDAEGVAYPDIGVGGSGPDRVPIPETVEPGTYRICTGNAGDEICTPIEIVAP